LKNLKLKAIVVVALAFMLFSATAAFADGIDISALGGTYAFTGAAGSTFSTTNLGLNGLFVRQTDPISGFPVGLPGTLSFTSGLYDGAGNFASGGSISYTNVGLCGGVCLSGSTTGGQLIGTTIVSFFTTNFVNPALAALVGANFGGGDPNATGSLSIVLAPSNTIASADYSLVTPEPASLLMLGGGLLAIGGSIRRKLNLI